MAGGEAGGGWEEMSGGGGGTGWRKGRRRDGELRGGRFVPVAARGEGGVRGGDRAGGEAGGG